MCARLKLIQVESQSLRLDLYRDRWDLRCNATSLGFKLLLSPFSGHVKFLACLLGCMGRSEMRQPQIAQIDMMTLIITTQLARNHRNQSWVLLDFQFPCYMHWHTSHTLWSLFERPKLGTNCAHSPKRDTTTINLGIRVKNIFKNIHLHMLHYILLIFHTNVVKLRTAPPISPRE